MDFLKLKKITKYICIFAVLILAIVLAGEVRAGDEDLDGVEGCVCTGVASEGSLKEEDITWVSVGSCQNDLEECLERCQREASGHGAVVDSTTGDCENEATARDNARSKLKKISVSDPSALIGTVLRAVLGLAGSIALLMFVYGGFLWLTSGGSPDKIKKAQGILVWATLGLVLIFASYTIVDKILLTFAS